MVRRSVFGWLLAGAFCASISCGGSNNGSAPQGFGLPCKTAKDCASYELFCGDGATCVACRGDGDCDSDEICSAGLCVAQDTCKNSRDCSVDQVCDQDAGLCVDCVTSQDCKTGQKCSANTCEDRPPCEFTSDCKGGLVCDIELKACVSCRNDDDCSSRRVCEDYECVLPTPMETGGTGAGGSSPSGGEPTGGTSAGGTGAGGSSAGGGAGGSSAGGGVAGTAGTGGSVGEGGAGGASECACALNQACTPDLRCVASTLIDDLLDCDNEILPIEGRQGDWAAGADTGINIMHGFTDPGSGWVDHSCAAWAAGGELTVGGPDTTFAFIGFRLDVNAQDEGLAYDLSAYNGIQLTLESNSYVQVVLKTTGGGYFQVTLSPLANGSHVRTAPFTSMLKMNNSAETFLDLSTVYEVQFSVTDPTSFGLAIHRVSLY